MSAKSSLSSFIIAGTLVLGMVPAIAQPIEATTATGEKVLLHPNGRAACRT